MSFVKTVGIVLAAIVLVVLVGLGVGQAQPGDKGQPTSVASASDGASPTPVDEPSADASPTNPTPVPTMAQRPGQLISATAEEDGIRVTLELDRARIAYGERVWSDVAVANTGTDDVYWGHSGTCVFAAGVTVITQVPFEFGSGRSDWGGEPGVLKSTTLSPEATTWAPGDAVAWFTPEGWVDFVGNMGCTTDLVIDVVPPGGELTYRAAWDADGPHGVPMRPGDYRVEAVFTYMGRGATAEPIDRQAVRVDLPLTVDSPDVDYLGPGEAVDRVLESQDFLDRFHDAPRGRWQASTLHFEGGAWVMRLYLDSPKEAIVATVNAISGLVLSVVVDSDAGEPIF
jgi:hypothetical protein